MATSCGRRQDIPPAAPKFFKIIMDPKAVTLRIPDDFTRRIGHNLPNRVFLKAPSGPTMEVELYQCNGKTMLQKGWNEFKERYSIGFGHFLVFEYNGKSELNVLIFDTTAVEVNYSFDAGYKRVTNQECPILQDNGMESDDFERKLDCRVKRDGSTYGLSLLTLKSMLNGYRSSIPNDGTGSKTAKLQRAVMKDTSIAYQKAVAFVSGHIPHNAPFHICLMRHSYVSYGFFLWLPWSFAERNLPCKDANWITMVANGKKWSVRCLVRNSRARLTGGWKGFVQDNELKVGDACIFIVAERTKPVWNVVIFQR